MQHWSFRDLCEMWSCTGREEGSGERRERMARERDRLDQREREIATIIFFVLPLVLLVRDRKYPI